MAENKPKTKQKQPLIYVFAGKDECLVNARCQDFVEHLTEPSQRATGLFTADAAQVSAADVLDELRTVPFLTAKRIVVLKNADQFISKNRDLLEKYFENPCPTGIFVLTVSSWPSRTKLAQKLPQVGKLIDVKEPKSWQLPGRLAEYASDAHGKKLNKDAAELLIELVGDELTRLYSELDKLALFTDNEKTISVAHVESLIGHNRMYGAFEVIDAVTAGETAEAVARLRNMFAEDKTAEFKVVGAFAFHFRKMYNAKALLEKGLSISAVAGALRVWSNKEGFFRQLDRVTLRQLAENLQELAWIDYAMKTGQTKAPVAMERLVLKLASQASTGENRVAGA